MSLELVVGPVSMTPDPDDAYVGGTAGFANGDRCIWLDWMGWCGSHGSNFTGGGLTRWLTCNLDGVTRLRQTVPSAFSIQQLNQDDLSNGLMASYSSGGPYIWNALVGGITQGPINTMTVAEIRTKVGWYRTSGNSIQRAPLGAADDTEFVTEHTFSPAPSSGADERLSLGPDNLLYWYTDNAGAEIIAYDYVLQEEVFPNSNGTNRWSLPAIVDACFYSRKFNTFMTYYDIGAAQGELRVFSTELTPSALSVPTASPAVAAGVVSTISVTLTDDNSVGIVGRLIDWSITVGNGVLLDTQTTTDENGIATTLYRAPISGGVNPTIQASLTY